MSASWWIGRQITEGREDRQQKKEIPHKETGVGNGTQPSAILDILDN
jgi:hypothetical protein